MSEKQSPVAKRSVVVNGHKTSVSLEDAFWSALKSIAAARGLTVADLVGLVDANREQRNLSSALRLFVLDHYKATAAIPDERRAA